MPQSLRKSNIKKTLGRKVYADGLFSLASGFHATSPQEETAILAERLDKPILVSPNGVDPEVADVMLGKVEALAHLGLPTDRRYIIFLGRIHRRKNPDILLEAALSANAFEKGWSLIIAGPEEDITLSHRMKLLAARRGIARFVHYTGMLGKERKALALRAADLFVLPSEFENFGNSIAEALACRLPVITTTNTPWISVRDRGAGWIIEPSLSELTAALMSALDTDRLRLQEMGLVGQKLVRDFSWTRAAKEMDGFYRSFVAERHLSTPCSALS